MAKRGRLIAIAVSIAILLSAFGLPATANGPQNSGQNNPGGYVKYTLDLINNTLINGNFVNTSNALEPVGVAYDPSNGYIYVTDSGSNAVSVIDGATNTVIANITVGTWPVGVAYDPSNGYIYVANYGSGTVSIISTSTQVTNTPPPPSSSSLTVLVYNVLGRPATTVPGVVLGVLYNSSGFKEVVYMNSSGYLNFYNIPPGTYTLEVYHYPNAGLNLTEYWGGMTVNLQPGSNFVTFYRHEPWIYNLQASASNGEIVVTVTVNGTVTSPTQGEIELWVTNNPSLASPYSPSNVFYFTINPGLNTFNFTYPVSQAGTYYVYAAVLTYISTYTVTDQWNWTPITIIQPPTPLTLPQNYQVILNLLNGQQYFGVPHVYQGDYNGTPTSQWPVYYGPNNASQYWSQGNITSNQPVLELTPYLGIPAYVLNKPGTAGSVFWDETYSGGSLTATLLGTFSNGQPSGQFADGFDIYLFLKPTMWSVSPQYNYSISYISTSRLQGVKVYLGGDEIIPQSSMPYLIVQWDPFLEPVYGVSGQWNVVILSNINGTNPSVVAGWNGIGTGFIYPNPGDLINVTVTYNPSTNTLSGVVTDLNTGQSVSFTLSLSGYFTPPSSGNYVFGIGAGTGWGYANWALLYVATTQQSTTPLPPSSSSTGLNLIPYFYNSSAMGGVYLNFTKAELGLFMPPVMLGNLSIPGIIDFNNMSYFVHTLEGPYVFNTTLGGWKVYGFTFVALPTYGNGSVVNPTYMLQKTMIIAYNGEKVIVLLYYRNLAPVPLELNQYWSHIHKGVDGLSFAVYPALFNPYASATEQVIQDAYYIDGNTSLYVNGSYLGQLNSFGLWWVLPVGPITLINNASGWYIQLIPMNNLSTTQQIQLVTNGFSIDNVTIANSFFNIQHAEVTLMPNQSAQYVYSIGINTQPPNYTEISGILSYLLQIASSFKPQNIPSSSSLTVLVYNVLGRPATTVPGVVLGVLYNSSGFKEVVYMNSSGYLNFYNIPPGTYTLEVYHYPNAGLNLTEYWGSETIDVQPGYNTATFYRHEPWIYNLQAVENGTGITINVTVDDPLSATLHGRLYIWVTTSPQTANPSEPTINAPITIGPGLNNFTYYYPTTQNGTYYIYAALLIYNRTQLITTDQWNWTAAMYQLKVIIINLGAPSVSFELYESNKNFSQGQIIASKEISGKKQIIPLNLTKGIYEYNLSLNSQGYTIAPSPTGFINLTKNERIYLFVIPTNISMNVNMIPVGLPDPSQWYVTYQDPFESLIFLPDKDGTIRLSMISFAVIMKLRNISYVVNPVNLSVYSTNPQYYPLLPIVQINITILVKYEFYNNETYVVPFATAGNAHIVDWNGVQWNPLLNEYSQPNFGYAYSYNVLFNAYSEYEDGFCWGMSSTAILYYLGFLPLPSQGANSTSQLYLGPWVSKNVVTGFFEIKPQSSLAYLTDASLAVAVHQMLDPLNNITIDKAPANETASIAIEYIDWNIPVILGINFTNQNGDSLHVGSGYHAVVAWGYIKEPNGDVVFLVYDPNYPQIITRAIYNPTNGSFIYIDGGPPYSVTVNGQKFSYPGDVGEVYGWAEPTPVYLSWFNPNKFKNIKLQQVQITQGGLLDYTLYVSTSPLKVYTGGELVGYFINNTYFVTAPTVPPGDLAGYVDGYPSRLYIVAVRNGFNAQVDPNSTLVVLRFANASGTITVYGFVVNTTGPVAVQFVNQSSFIVASRNNTAVKLELFSVTNSSVKTYNTTLWLSNRTGYVVSANFTNLTNATIKTVTVSWGNVTSTQTATATTTTTSSASTSTSISTGTITTATTTTSSSTSSVTVSTTSSITNSVKPSHSALPTWVAAAVIVVLVLIIALLMGRRSKP